MCICLCACRVGEARKGVKEKLKNSGSGRWEEASLQIKIKALTDNTLEMHILCLFKKKKAEGQLDTS